MTVQSRLVSSLILLSLLLLGVPGLRAQDATTNTWGDLKDKYQDKLFSLMTVDELIAYLKNAGLSTKGNKDELLQRALQNSGAPGTAASQTDQNSATPPDKGSKDSMVVTIESADEISKFSVSTPEQNIVELSGAVSVKIADSSSGDLHEIKADHITYNQDRKEFHAWGNVIYHLVSGGNDQVFTGNELVFDTDSKFGVFLDGTIISPQQISGKMQDFIVVGELITRSVNNVLQMNNVEITASVWTPPAWKIRASRMRILSRGEWEIEGGTLYVGSLPVLPLPAFYYPNDDMIFHPSTGYDTTKGMYIQTTTYLLGRKKQGKSSLSVFDLGKSNTAENSTLVPHDLFLESGASTKTDSNTQTANNATFKVDLDTYTLLGTLAGIEYSFKPGQDTLEGRFFLGLSKSLFSSGSYTTFDPALSVPTEHWEQGYFFGAAIPFRFANEFKYKFSASGVSIDVSLPFASDPRFGADFYQRAEEMDWGGLIGLTGPSSTTSANSPFDIKTTLSYQVPVDGVKPYISNLSLNNFRIEWPWAEKSWSSGQPGWVSSAYRSSEKTFYAPGLLTLPEISASISGNIPLTGGAPPKNETAKSAQADEKKKDPIAGIWKPGETPDDSVGSDDSEADLAQPPKSIGVTSGPSESAGPGINITYGIQPSFALQAGFPEFQNPTLVGINPDYWVGSVGLSANLGLSGNFGGLGSTQLGLSFTDSEKKSLYSSPALDATAKAFLETNFAKALVRSLSANFRLGFTPFAGVDLLSRTSVDYSMGATLYRENFDKLDVSGLPSNKIVTLDWNKESITAHAVAASLVLSADQVTASLTQSLTLPPQDLKWNYAFSLGIPWMDMKASGAVGTSNSVQIPNEISLSDTLKIVDGLSVDQSAVLSFDKAALKSYHVGVSAFGFKANLDAAVAQAQTFVPGLGWNKSGAEAFQVTKLGASYSQTFEPDFLNSRDVKNKLGVDLGYGQSFIQVTDSALSWRFSWSLSIVKLLSVQLSFSGENTRMYRYFSGLTDGLGLETRDIFLDLLKSFNFFNDADRIESFFDMKSISLSLQHDLGDWTLDLRYSGSPKINSTTKSVTWSSSLSFLLSWKSISEIKTSFTATDGVFSVPK